jgi:hypothetical protein
MAAANCIMIKNIVCEYEDGVDPSGDRQGLFINSVQMWLRPFSEAINAQNGKVTLYFSTGAANMFRLEGVDERLNGQVMERFAEFML